MPTLWQPLCPLCQQESLQSRTWIHKGDPDEDEEDYKEDVLYCPRCDRVIEECQLMNTTTTLTLSIPQSRHLATVLIDQLYGRLAEGREDEDDWMLLNTVFQIIDALETNYPELAQGLRAVLNMPRATELYYRKWAEVSERTIGTN